MTIKVLSLGWGVQSFTIVAMVALGELEPIDYAIHADTTYEKKATRDLAMKYTDWLAARGVTVYTVTHESRSDIALGKIGGSVTIPAHTQLPHKNKSGILKRQCTEDWKVAPVRKHLQMNRNKESVELWLGISTDEMRRVKASPVKYITHRYPLIEKGMSRNDCITWLVKNSIDIPRKSSCVICPFHDKKGWQEVKSVPEDWDVAVDIDRKIRKMRPPFDLYLHSSCIPLEMIDLRTPQEMGQYNLFGKKEEK